MFHSQTKRASVLLAIAAGLLLWACKKEDPMPCDPTTENPSEMPPDTTCDLQDYVGDWDFILNSDSSTAHRGVIHKFNDSIINVTYQPDTAWTYFVQVEVNCYENEVVYMELPAGNHGTTTIEGSITPSTFNYRRTKILDGPFGPDTTLTHIVGLRVE